MTLLDWKKVPCIPPIYDNYKFVTGFKKKCQPFLKTMYFMEKY